MDEGFLTLMMTGLSVPLVATVCAYVSVMKTADAKLALLMLKQSPKLQSKPMQIFGSVSAASDLCHFSFVMLMLQISPQGLHWQNTHN